MLSRLVHDRCSQKPCGIELRDSETVKPSFVIAREAPNPRARAVPRRHVNPIAPALAEEKNRHIGA
jgi:hypothetical protein